MAQSNSKKKFHKVLVANRGEIAVRILRALRELGMQSVAVYSEIDRHSLHVRMADEAYCIGPALASQSYLCIEKIIDAAKKSGAEAIHPGYGFLSENSTFAQACVDHNLIFIGPPPHAISAMGSKTNARALMQKAGVPIVPGGMANTLDEVRREAARIGYPVMLKATSGGGGKGMRLVEREEDLSSAWEHARNEAAKAFGNDEVYIEKAIVRPKHVEIQVLGDQHGNVIHLFERDCSIQRRHQKVVEESPCPIASRDLVQQMGNVAVQGAKAVGYHSAGTFEFLLDSNGSFYFLEMNTRLQVEHPITELVTGIDVVHEMIQVALGEPIGYTQQDIQQRGAAIECRIYAEDPTNNFLPNTGTISLLRTPSGPGIRDDSGVYEGSKISSFYDPMISKLSVWAPSRQAAIARMQRALREYLLTGLQTNLEFHKRLLEHPEFLAGHYDTSFIGNHMTTLTTEPLPDNPTQLAASIALVQSLQNQQQALEQHRSSSTHATSAWVNQRRLYSRT